MNKVVRDGKVAVLISPGYGAGWYTWNTGSTACLYDPETVAWVEAGKPSDSMPNWEAKFGDDFYDGSSEQLTIEWVPENAQFRVDVYDGSEWLVLATDEKWLTA